MEKNQKKETLSQEALPKKWGALSGKQWSGPKWARTRIHITWNSGKTAQFHSYDYIKRFKHGVVFKDKSERIGLDKLIENVICKKDPFSYKVINVFVNLSANLCTKEGDFNYHILTVVRGRFTWKNPMYFLVDKPEMFDVKKMQAYKKAKDDQVAREEARIEVQMALEKTALK